MWVATTGVSGVIDAYGRVTASLGLGERGFVDARLPQPTAEPTVYARLGDMPFWVLWAAGSGILWLRRKEAKVFA